MFSFLKTAPGAIALGISVASSIFLALLVTGAALSQSIAVSIAPILFILLFTSPFAFLSTLLLIRPSLDRMSEFFTLPIPFAQDVSITLAQAIGASVVLLGVVFFFQFRKRIVRIPLFSIFTLLLVWGALTLFYSIDPTQTLYELFRLFSIFFVFALGYFTISNEKRFQTLLGIILLSCAIPILAGWWQFINGIGYTDSEFSIARMYGTFAHPNIFALYLVVASAAGAILFSIAKRQSEKAFAAFGLLAILATLLFTYARGAWGAFLAFTGLFVLIKKPKIIPLFAIFPLVAFLFFPVVQNRVEDILHPSSTSSFSWRLTLWHDTISQTFSEGKQLLGHGLGTFETLAENLRGSRFDVHNPHSEFVRSFVEGGYAGLLVFLVFSLAPFIVITRNFLNARSEPTSEQTKNAQTVFLILGCLFVSLLLLSFTDHVLRSTMAQWTLFAMLGGALRVYGKQKEPGR